MEIKHDIEEKASTSLAAEESGSMEAKRHQNLGANKWEIGELPLLLAESRREMGMLWQCC